MTKKIGLFFLSVIMILLFGVSFADIIPDNSHYVNRCVKLQNVDIDNYRVIVENDTVTSRDVYEPNADECLRGHYKFGESRQYLLDKSVDIEEITRENIQEIAIQIGNLRVIGRYINNSNSLISENIAYKVVKDGKDFKLVEVSENKLESDTPFECTDCVDADDVIDTEDLIENVVEDESFEFVLKSDKYKDFSIAWILTILIETVVLFVIFGKKDYIPNLRILLVGIFASTVTLPLLRFVLPLFIKDGVEYTVIGESLVTLIEIFIIKYGLKISRGKAILVSILCNLCSYILGIIIL